MYLGAMGHIGYMMGFGVDQGEPRIPGLLKVGGNTMGSGPYRNILAYDPGHLDAYIHMNIA